MLSKFESMWDGHLIIITTAKHRIELVDLTTPLVRSALYRAGPEVREFKKTEITKMLEDNVIEPTQTERASPEVFALKRDSALRFYVNHCKQNGLINRDS